MNYQGKHILVTGGTGFVGSHFAEDLLHRGARVRIPLHHRALRKFEGTDSKQLETIQADLSRREDCLRVCEGVDYVIHAAGGVGAAGLKESVILRQITENLVLTVRMLEAASAQDVRRFLLFSSSTGYPLTDHPVKEEEMWTAPPPDVYLGYGWMRRYFELLGQFITANSTMDVAICRPTAIYGRYDNFASPGSHVIPSLIRKAVQKDDPFEVWGSGDQIRDFLHVKDLVRGALLILDKHPTSVPINIGYGKPTTIRDIVNIILAATGHQPKQLIFDTSKPSALPVRVVDTAKAKDLLGFEPKISLETGIADTVNWYIKETA